jgi:hypothetical protein
MKLRPYWTAAYPGDDSNISSIGKGTVTNTIAGRIPQVYIPQHLLRNSTLPIWEPLSIGFVTGIPRVGNFNTVPAPVYTVPVSGTGTYRTRSATVSYETHGISGTRG